MNELSEIVGKDSVLTRAFSELGATAAALMPRLVGALLLLLVGWAVSRLAEVVARRGLRALGIDRAAARLELGEVLDRAGVGMSLSALVGRLLFWLVMLTFVVSSVETLGLTAVTATIDRIVAYIPNLIGASITLVLGLLLARFLAGVTSSAAAAAGIPSAPRLGIVVQLVVGALVVVVTVEQIGLATDVLVGPLTALTAAAAFSAGLAFALGARPIITHILAGHFLKQTLPKDSFVEVEGHRGVVERIGPTDTILRNDKERWSVPNAHLLERVVAR